MNAGPSTSSSGSSNTSSASASSGFGSWLSTFENAFSNLFNTNSSQATSNTGTSTSSTVSPYAADLYKAGLQRVNTTAPVLQQFSNQALEAMRTGGVGTNIPIVSRAIDASTAASGISMEQLRQNLARAGFSGSSFATNALTNEATAAGQSAAAIGPAAAQSYIAQAPTLGLDTGGTNAVAQAGGLDATTTGATAGTGTSTETGSGTSSGTTGGNSSGAGSQYGNTIGTSNGTQQQTSQTTPGFWDTFLQGLGLFS
jgi:hypothetical protein